MEFFRATKYKLEFQRIIRFLVVGFANFAAGYAIFLALIALVRLNHLLSAMTTSIIWLWFGFNLQRKLTFRSRRNPGQMRRYLVSQLVSSVIALLLLALLVEIFEFSPAISYIPSAVGQVIVNYALQKTWVFSRPGGSKTWLG